MIQHYKKEIKSLIIIFMFKIIILSLLPLTGDEAYFIRWAQNISSGYYDHPPMVGWIIYLLSFINDSYIFYRLFAVITTFIAAVVIYKIALIYKISKEKAFFTSLIFLASPIDILLSLMTNDITLLFFGSLGTLFLIYSMEKNHWFLYSVLAGVFLGSAFLSKYFAVFLMLGLIIFLLSVYKTKAIKNILIITIVISLFIAQNLYYNYNSCWNNIMFNFFARTNNNYNIEGVLEYFIFIIYIFTPWGIYFLLKEKFNNKKLLKLLSPILLVAFSVFFIVSLKNKVGLHWFLLFTPFIFLFFVFIKQKYQEKLFKYNIRFTYLHIIILIILIIFPKTLLKNQHNYAEIILFTNPKEVCKVIDTTKNNQIFTFSYSQASVLNYYCNKKITVLFSNSKYGRLDDKLLDVRNLNKKNITLFDKSPITDTTVRKVCSNIKVKQLDIKGAKFYQAECKNFNYNAYKEIYLKVQKKKFYNIPSWLPIGKCYFLDRYFK